jgi:hypothetical protein
MLQLNGAAFCTGRSDFLDVPSAPAESSAKLFVRLRLSGLETLGQVDTGAAWSVITPDIADVLGLFDGDGPEAQISTRHGVVAGRLERVTLTFPASAGESLDIDATVFVSRAWPAGTFVGWTGLLERVRFAVDPRENHFYFGPVESATR